MKRHYAVPLIFVYGIASLGAVLGTVKSWSDTYNLVVTVDQQVTDQVDQDFLLKKDLENLAISPLMTIKHNVARVEALKSLEVAQIKINLEKVSKDSSDSGELLSSAVREKMSLDRIGQYYNANIRVEGDFYQQAYILQYMTDNFPHFLLVEEIQGDVSTLSIKARIYGREIESA